MTSALLSTGSTRRWRRLRAYVLHRDGYRCQLWVDGAGRHVEDDDPAAGVRRCLAWASHADHVVERQLADAAGMVTTPAGRLHVDDPRNLRASCQLGNLARRPNDRPRTGRPAVTHTHPRRWSW